MNGCRKKSEADIRSFGFLTNKEQISSASKGDVPFGIFGFYKITQMKQIWLRLCVFRVNRG